jgi:colanic acid biosynthesis glycosyl transferase WcaI
MRAIIWGINYAPEPTGIGPYTAELAEFLAGRGWQVEAVVGFPYYPAWRRRPEDRGRLYRAETIRGVAVHRCALYVPRRLSAARRVLHELSFAAASLPRLLRLPRADVYVVASPPLGLGPLAWLVTRLKRSRYLFHVQDLQPDSAAGLGMMRPGLLLRLLYAVERFTYARAEAVSAISGGMAAAIAAKGVPAGKVVLLPNWLRPAAAPAAGDFRARHGIAPGALLAVYAGNLGRKQGLSILLDAAAQLARAEPAGRPVAIVIAGDGAGRAELAARLAAAPLPGVRLLPLLDEADYRALLRAADLALVTQLAGTGQVCFPSKLLSVLAAGLPAVCVCDPTSDLARAVGEGGFGCWVPSGDAAALAAALAAAAQDPGLCRRWAGRTGWVRQFSPDAVLPRFEALLRRLAAADGAAAPLPEPVSGPLPLA